MRGAEVAVVEMTEWIRRRAHSVNGRRGGDCPDDIEAIQELDVSGAAIDDLPAAFGQLQGLRRLNLSRTGLRRIPEAVFELEGLRELNIARCGLEDIGDGIGRLCNLEQLLVSRNQLRRLPAELGLLTKLRLMNIRNNRLTTLPETVCNLGALYELDASENSLSFLPSNLVGLRSLRNLYVSGNELKALPESLARCQSLRSLALSGNLLTRVDDGILELPNLETLWLYDNPLEDPPSEIADRGLERIRIWLHARRRASAGNATTIRALVLGDGRVGKSSLVDRLTTDTHNPHRHRTPTMVITPWRPRSGLDVKLWDFGGQKPMQDVHRLFLARRAAVVLVIDSPSTRDVEHWLRLAQPVASPNSILVVLNKIDKDPDLDVDRRTLLAKWPAIAGFVRTSMRTGEGVDALRTELSALVERVASGFPRLPASWDWVRSNLQALAVDHIDEPSYRNICAQAGVTETAQAEALLDYLVDTGTVMTLSVGRTYSIILRPQWLVDGIYRIVNHPEPLRRGGIIDMNVISTILSDSRYKDDGLSAVVSVMVANDFAFRRGSDLVIPSLLPDRRPDLPGSAAPTVSLDLRLSHIPPGLFARLLSRLGTDAEAIWRTGIRLADRRFEATGDLALDNELQVISVSVWGESPRDFLSVLRHRVCALAQEVKVEIDETIPLPNGGRVLLSDLLAYEAAGVPQLFDPASRQEYDVGLLLNGRRQVVEQGPGDTYNIDADIVSFGDGSLNIAMTGRVESDLRRLIEAVASSDLAIRDDLVDSLREAESSGDVGRIRAASLTALDAGAKVAAIAAAATAVLNHL